MKNMLRLAAMAPLLALAIDPALAQIPPAPPGSTVDLAPIINPLMSIAGLIILLLVIPIAFKYLQKLAAEYGIAAEAELAALQAGVNGIAQTAIGQTIARLNIKPGEITIDVKNQIIADAANTIVKNASEKLTKLGVPDNEQMNKARDFVEARLGLMAATAAGVPVPNPSMPPAPTPTIAPAAPTPMPDPPHSSSRR